MDSTFIILGIIGLAAALFIVLKIRKTFKKGDCSSCCGSCSGSCSSCEKSCKK